MKSPYIKIITDLIVRTLLKLSGFQAYVLSFIVKKLVELGIIEGKKAVETIKDNSTLKEFEKIKDKPSPERDQLEKDILTGK